MKVFSFSLGLLLFAATMSIAPQSAAAECDFAGGEGCVTGACPTDYTQVANTCSNSVNGEKRTCCKKNSTTPGGVPTPGTPASANATDGSSAVNIRLSNPLKYDTVEGFLTGVMTAIKNIVVTLAILMIVIGGVMYILSFGNAENMKRAKNVILAALVGLAIVLAAPAFLKEIYTLLGSGPEPAELSGALTLTQIARNILHFLLAIIGILAMIMMIISGIMYLTSAGNEARLKQAKGIFVASLIGIAVAMASLVLVTAVASFFD